MATIPPINDVYEFLENYLNDEDNSTVFGTALAYNPDLENSSPFVFRGETGLERVDIADNFDYTQAIWYQAPVEMEEALWSEPYFDVRGAGEDIALTTYSIPLYENGEFVAIVTNDLLLESIEDLEAQQTPISDALDSFAETFNPDANGDGVLDDQDIEGIFEDLETYLNDEGSSTVFGSAFAFNPDVQSAAPFVFRGEEGLERTDVPPGTDYTTTVWYAEPVEAGEAVWSSPYFDVTGAGEDIFLTTYSIPFFAEDESLVGVLTSDLLIESFEAGEIESQQDVIRESALELAEDISEDLLEIPVPPTAPFIQQDLYFGLTRPDGSEISEAEFQTFLDDSIAPNFPGLTLFDAQGQVQDGDTILTEPSRVVTLLLEDTAEDQAAVNQVVSEYGEQFGGAGVLEVVNKDDLEVSFGVAEDIIENDPTPELIQADLYFGRSFDEGEVSDEQFEAFVSDEIASRFPGLTQFDAQGRVRDSDGNILSENSKVVTLLLEDTEANETAIQDVLGLYQQEFSGSGVAQTVNEDVAIAFEVVDDIIENDPTPEIIQADLYFGRNFDGGEVSDEQFETFVNDQIISRFPGLTEFDAQGQVGDNAENSKVVTLLLEDTEANETAIQDVLTAYQEEFNGAGIAQVIDEDIETSLDATTSGADNLEGDDGDDAISGLGGNDTIAGFAGNDELLGNRGNDSINGGAGDDTLKGGYENDTLKGGSGDDSLIGWIGNDALLGGGGEDTLSGGQGRDRLNGGEGDDTLTGGASKDKFIFAANQAFSEVELGVDEITDFVSGQDMILLDLTTFAAITTEAGASLGDEFAIVDGEDLVFGSEAIIVYDSANSTLYYNPNGSEDGLGNGDRFAIFSNDASLTVDDFIIRA